MRRTTELVALERVIAIVRIGSSIIYLTIGVVFAVYLDIVSANSLIIF